MKSTRQLLELESQYTSLLLDLIEQKALNGPRTYGFEYEFIAAHTLNLQLMEEIYRFLPKTGFVPDEGRFTHSSGTYITFEPGGQIEYHSTPILPEDNETVNRTLALMEKTNARICQELGIEYLARGYVAGRRDAPLCLVSKRYRDLHSLMPKSGSRGLEMMKGTASVHLHVVIRNLRELAPLFSFLCEISLMEEFKMQHDRREIWNNTDPSRCGLPFRGIGKDGNPQRVVEELVKFALKAHDISSDKPFYRTDRSSFEGFIYHMTTIFTDVRLNLKGPSIELRTLDSMAFSEFREKWNKFISLLEQIPKP